MPKYTEPINNYHPPKSDNPEIIKWLANWLNNRRSQLYDNLGGLFHLTSRDTFNIPLQEWAEAHWPNKRTYVNKNFYSQIENAASAKLYNHTLRDWDGGLAIGLYRPRDHSVHVRPPIFDEENYGNTVLHEYTHAMNARPQEYTIGEILRSSLINPNYNIGDDIGYLLDPGEIYSRMMEFRYINKVKPTLIIDKNFINSHRDSIKQLRLNMFKDEDLVRLFNEVASNDTEEINIT